MNARLKEIRERLAAIKPDIDTLGTAETLTEEEETRLSDSITEWDTLTEEAKPLELREKKVAEVRAAAAQPGAMIDGDGATGAPQVMRRVNPFEGEPERMTRGEARDKALKVLDSDELTSHLDERQKVALSKLVRTQNKSTDGAMIARRLLVTESEEYRSAFMKRAVSDTPVFTAEEGTALRRFDEFRAMSIGTDGAGGFGVPVLIDPTIILTAQGSANPILAVSRIETITNDEWKGVSSAGVSWGFAAEGAVATDNSPTLAQPNVKAHKARGFIPFSIEVGMDYPGFASEMATLLSEGYSELLAQKFAVGAGDGSNEPFGIVTALNGTASEVEAAGTLTFTDDDVNTLWAALPERFRANATWLSSTTVNGLVQQMGNGADASFTVSFTAEGVTVLKGRPARVTDYMTSAINTATPFLIVGDFRNFLIAQRAGMSVELIPHLTQQATAGTGVGMPTGQRGWFAWARVGSDSVNDNGFRALSNAS
jgi:HK97 family phage major capsid protein